MFYRRPHTYQLYAWKQQCRGGSPWSVMEQASLVQFFSVAEYRGDINIAYPLLAVVCSHNIINYYPLLGCKGKVEYTCATIATFP